MAIDLFSHDKGYQLSFNECLLSIGTLSGIPYAKRHWELSNQTEHEAHWLGHRVMAIIEAMPVIGGIVAMIETVVSKIFRSFHSNASLEIEDSGVHTPSRVAFSLEQDRAKLDSKEDVEELKPKEKTPPAIPKSPISHSKPSLTDPSPLASPLKVEEPQVPPLKRKDTPVARGISRFASNPATARPGPPKFSKVKTSEIDPAVAQAKKLKKAAGESGIKTRDIDPFVSMRKNASKAINEHRFLDRGPSYATQAEIGPISRDGCAHSFTFQHQIFADMGDRDYMEDRHFFAETEKTLLTGIFDGHGGAEVAQFANQQFQSRFEAALHDADGDVSSALQKTIDEIHGEVLKNKTWDKQGCTAVIVYIDKQTNLVYTATLGDSEAFLYGEINGQWKAIPLSCVRDWASEKDAARAEKALNQPGLKARWMQNKGTSKYLRFPEGGKTTTNVSRSIGDARLTTYNGKEGLSHKAKVTVNQLRQGFLVLGSDGLTDFSAEKERLEIVKEGSEIARKLGEYALKKPSLADHDNITVLAIEIKSESRG